MAIKSRYSAYYEVYCRQITECSKENDTQKSILGRLKQIKSQEMAEKKI